MSYCWPKRWDLSDIHSLNKARQRLWLWECITTKTICISVNSILIVSTDTQSLHCADMATLSVQVGRSMQVTAGQVIKMHATAKPNMQTHLQWEQIGPKPGLWSWHLIPTSCRLSEQLQGRTLQLSCNDQFDTAQQTQQSQLKSKNNEQFINEFKADYLLWL